MVIYANADIVFLPNLQETVNQVCVYVCVYVLVCLADVHVCFHVCACLTLVSHFYWQVQASFGHQFFAVGKRIDLPHAATRAFENEFVKDALQCIQKTPTQ